jgi:hypothetical protein
MLKPERWTAQATFAVFEKLHAKTAGEVLTRNNIMPSKCAGYYYYSTTQTNFIKKNVVL